jgi:hypothetical protein
VIRLANLLDGLVLDGRVHLTETESKVIVSAINFSDANDVLFECARLGWEAEIYDEEGTKWDFAEIFQESEPFRINFSKPACHKNTVRILTNAGFNAWLACGSVDVVLLLATIDFPIKTYGRLIAPWEHLGDFTPKEKTKNPRHLVRETTEVRLVPDDINIWLADDVDSLNFDTVALQVWAKHAISNMLLSLANEVDSDSQGLKFKGPPKLFLDSISDSDYPLRELSVDGFLKLHQAVCWVYENERESEVKHALLANEISRAGREGDETLLYVSKHISDALSGAKVAYQMSISEIGKETLKALAELRKAVTDETAKVAESTRQIITAIATSLAVGVGLIATRLLATNLPDFIIPAIMVVVVIHVAAVIISGFNYIRIQSELREDWQFRLYRFIPAGEYDKMVKRPIKKAEDSFYIASWLGSAAVLILFIIVIFGGVKPEPKFNYNSINNFSSSSVVKYISEDAKENIPPVRVYGNEK